MNVMCMTSADSIGVAQTDRFITLSRLSNPACKYHLLVVNHDTNAIDISYLFDKFDVVKFTTAAIGLNKSQDLFTFDYLKSTLLNVFNLTEGLYVDTDVDIVRGLSGLETMAEHKPVTLWTADPIYSNDRNYPDISFLINRANPISDNDITRYVQSGFLYLSNIDYAALFSKAVEILKQDKNDFIHNSFIPGSGIWNLNGSLAA